MKTGKQSTKKCIRHKFTENQSELIPAYKSKSFVIITNDQPMSKIQSYLEDKQMIKMINNTKTYNAELSKQISLTMTA